MSDCIPRLAASHSPVFLLNSCLDLFSAPPGRYTREDPFSRSYGVSLPSSLTVNLSSASVFSTRPPVSVYGTGRPCLGRTARIFSGACPHGIVARRKRLAYCRGSATAFPPQCSPTPLQRTIPSVRTRFASPSPLVLDTAGSRNIDRVSIRLSIPGGR